MKYITFTVPSYNSAAYMRKCIESLLPAGEDAEIIIVNDGSKDETGKIADEYVEKYPTIVKAIHQENGGHGEGVNQGIRNATGLYFKVVDSDDWLDGDSLKKLMDTIKMLHAEENDVDLIFCNYVYEHVEDNKQYRMHYKNAFPRDKVFTWKTMKRFHIYQFLMMHSMVFRTQVLRDAKLELPKHTFYVDNIFMLQPLPYVKTMYYINEDLYRYFIGRADQSVNEEVMMRRLDQHIRVTDILIDGYDYRAVRKISRKMERYMTRHIGILIAATSVFLAIDGSEEALARRKKYWKDIYAKDKGLYRELRSTVAGLTQLPGKGGRAIAIKGYRATRKIFKYN